MRPDRARSVQSSFSDISECEHLKSFSLTLLAHQAFITSVKNIILAGEVTFITLTANRLLLLSAEAVQVLT